MGQLLGLGVGPLSPQASREALPLQGKGREVGLRAGAKAGRAASCGSSCSRQGRPGAAGGLRTSRPAAAVLVLGDRRRSAGRVNSQAGAQNKDPAGLRAKDWGEGRSRTSEVC